MARFVQISDDDVKMFHEEHENENTRKKFYDTKVLLEFLVAEGERRKIEEIPPNELKNLAKRFVLSAKKRTAKCFDSVD
jgi:hypothetical protein